MDLISVIVPIYNVQQYLERCIKSILEQTYKNLEIILVDDGSKDNCPNMCDKYKEKDKRIIVIHKKNGGLSDARNAGIKIARGDFLVFIDSDDYIRADMIEKLHSIIVEDKSDMAICGVEKVFEELEKKEKKEKNPWKREIWTKEHFWQVYYETLYRMECVVAWNKIYKKELFRTERYDTGKIHEDEFICHRIIDQCDRISVIPEKMYFYVQRKSGIMGAKNALTDMDLSDAYVKRAIYFEKKGMQKYTQIALTEALIILTDFKLRTLSKFQRKKYRNSKKIFNEAYFIVFKNRKPLRFTLNMTSFLIGKWFYELMHLYKKIG